MADDGSAGRALGKDAPCVVAVHSQLETLLPIRDGWSRLAAQPGASAAQTYDYVAAAWRITSGRPGTELSVISVTKNDELVAIWPLYVVRADGLKIAKHLGCGGDEEYAGPLVVDDGRGREAAAAALEAATSKADVLKVYNIAADHIVGGLLDDLRGLKHKSWVNSPVVTAADAGVSWDDWVAGRSKSFRSGLKYDRKQLSKIGEVRLEKVEGLPEIERVVAWIFDVKRSSLKAHGIHKSWVFGAEGQQLFADVAKVSDGVNVYALMAGEVIAAAAIVFESTGSVEYYVTSYNHDLHAYSPGNLLLEDLVKICLARRSVLDFRITGESYKIRWATGARRFDSHIIATSWRGVPLVLNHIRSRAEVRMKIAIKAKLAALRQKLRKAAPPP